MGHNRPTGPDAALWPTTVFSQRPCFPQAALDQWWRPQGTEAGRLGLLWQATMAHQPCRTSSELPWALEGPIQALCTREGPSPESGDSPCISPGSSDFPWSATSPNKLTRVYPASRVLLREPRLTGWQASHIFWRQNAQAGKCPAKLLCPCIRGLKWISDWGNLSPRPQSTHYRWSVILTEMKAARCVQRD